MEGFYCDRFVLPLPPEHRFPMAKYRLLREAVEEKGLFAPGRLRVPAAATDGELLRAHQPGYLRRVVDGALEPAEIRRIGFPWSSELVERSRRSVGGTIGACRSALEHGRGANLAGGTHHAFADRGEGYCVFNDVAVALRAAQSDGSIRRAVVLDCDVHQGNGTASIFRADPSVFTFSIHGRRNFPFHKEESDLDVELDDGIGDDAYLEALEAGVTRALSAARADLAVYVAGADPFHRDRLGRLALTRRGLAERDRRVFEECDRRGLPVAVVMAGGYAEPVTEIVRIHLETLRIAAGRPAPGVPATGAEEATPWPA